jgi:tRNA/rRNA methyltransferase/tRNA (cytidine32/uridine32-2'-O)-methyltransferase
MKNMGLSRLRLVSPDPMEEKTIRSRAVHAETVWEGAEKFESLVAAVADCAMVIGTTRRRGHSRKSFTLNPEETAEYLRERPGNAALVFGNERTGLEGPELNLCNLASHIPADRAFPSLNLSHAVQIYCYELFRSLAPAPGTPREGPVAGDRWAALDQSHLEELVRSVSGALASLGFYKQPGREAQEQFFRDIFSRAALTLDEGRYMANIFAKAARLGNEPPRPEGRGIL